MAKERLQQRMMYLWRKRGLPKSRQTSRKGQETGKMCAWEKTNAVRCMDGLWCCCPEPTAMRVYPVSWQKRGG